MSKHLIFVLVCFSITQSFAETCFKMLSNSNTIEYLVPEPGSPDIHVFVDKTINSHKVQIYTELSDGEDYLYKYNIHPGYILKITDPAGVENKYFINELVGANMLSGINISGISSLSELEKLSQVWFKSSPFYTSNQVKSNDQVIDPSVAEKFEAVKINSAPSSEVLRAMEAYNKLQTYLRQGIYSFKIKGHSLQFEIPTAENSPFTENTIALLFPRDLIGALWGTGDIPIVEPPATSDREQSINAWIYRNALSSFGYSRIELSEEVAPDGTKIVSAIQRHRPANWDQDGHTEVKIELLISSTGEIIALKMTNDNSPNRETYEIEVNIDDFILAEADAN